MTVSQAGDTLRVSIGDSGGSSAPRLDDDGDEPGMPVSGRGLRIVNALASSWGYSGDELGRVVWFEVIRKDDQ